MQRVNQEYSLWCDLVLFMTFYQGFIQHCVHYPLFFWILKKDIPACSRRPRPSKRAPCFSKHLKQPYSKTVYPPVILCGIHYDDLKTSACWSTVAAPPPLRQLWLSGSGWAWMFECDLCHVRHFWRLENHYKNQFPPLKESTLTSIFLKNVYCLSYNQVLTFGVFHG